MRSKPLFAPWFAFAVIVAVLCAFSARGGDAVSPEWPKGEKLGWPDALHLVAGPRGGQWNALGLELEKLLRAEGIPTQNHVGGGVENLRAIGAGEADFGFTLYSFLGAAGAGEKELPVVDLDNAVLLVNLYPQVLYIIVRSEVARKHNIKALGDLLKVKEPIRFSTLPKGTGSEFIFNMLLKSAYRTSYDELEGQGWSINFRSYAEITKLFLNSELDVCAYTAGPGTYLIPQLEESDLDAVLLPVEDEMLDLMTHQFMTISYIIEKGDYKSVTEDVVTLGDYSSLVVQAKIPEDLVYRINEIIWNKRSELGKVSGDMNSLSPRFAIAGQSKVHPGSLRFWNSEAMQKLKRGKR